ncbi:MAG: AraC family transcriptional regulator [Ktedonobacteraceae bacterium]|nr:AraC family transcriptional regulator [Chloroflexota bacterium]
MGIQNRTYVTLSPRMRKALELCATFDGSTPASYAAMLLSSALTLEIEQQPALQERWHELAREALLKGSWDAISLPGVSKGEEAEPPEMKLQGWTLAGSTPGDYESGVDNEVRCQGKPSGYLRSKALEAAGFGTLMQKFRAEEYRNKRLRLTAMVKAESIEHWAGLWMRVDGPLREVLSFDNMQSRPIQGTSDWQPYEVVLDVPEKSVNIAFGLLLEGPGQAWVNEIQFTEVSKDVPITSQQSLDQPTNLDFAIKQA